MRVAEHECSINVLLLLVIYVCLFFLCDAQEEDTPAFPVIPTQYSANVIVTYPELGYTLAYAEYYDSELGLSRNDGRMTYTDIIDYFNWVSGELYHYDPTAGTCGRMALPANAFTLPNFAPSSALWFFAVARQVPPTYVDEPTAVDRGVLCNHWRLTYAEPSVFPMTASWVIDYFLSVNSDEPISVTLEKTVVNASDPLAAPMISHELFDWTGWWSTPPNPASLSLPAICIDAALMDDTPEFLVPTVSSVAPMASSTLAAPTIPNQFSVILETVLDETSSLVDTVVWMADGSAGREKLDYQLSGRQFDMPTVIINLYNVSLAQGGFVSYTASKSEGPVCVASVLPRSQMPPFLGGSPLARIHAGSIPELFSGSVNRNYTYVDRVLTRGVDCDVYSASLNRVGADGNQYNFTESLYFFPEGWQFPGHPTSIRRSQLPFRIAVSGTYTGTDLTLGLPTVSPVSYSETWDFFLFVPQRPPASSLDPSQYLCELPSTSGSDSPQSVGSSTSVAVIVILCLTSVATAVGFYVWCRTKRGRHSFDPPDVEESRTTTMRGRRSFDPPDVETAATRAHTTSRTFVNESTALDEP